MIKKLIIAVLITFIAATSLSEYYGIRINQTDSLPGLFWKQRPHRQSQITTGHTVFLCPPNTETFKQARERQYIPFGLKCPGYLTPLLKPVAGIAGDTITLTSTHQISINGQVHPNSTLWANDTQSRPMPQTLSFPFVVPEGQVFLLSTYNPRSFDSRYFGPLPLSNIIGLAEPLWGNPTIKTINIH